MLGSPGPPPLVRGRTGTPLEELARAVNSLRYRWAVAAGAVGPDGNVLSTPMVLRLLVDFQVPAESLDRFPIRDSDLYPYLPAQVDEPLRSATLASHADLRFPVVDQVQFTIELGLGSGG